MALFFAKSVNETLMDSPGPQQRRTGQTRSVALERLDLSRHLVARLRRSPWPQGPSDRQADSHARGRLLDLSNRSDIVADPFLGSGSTLIAADKTGRVCRGVELDPLYVDVIMRRYEAATGGPAVLVETGEAFDRLAGRRSREAAPA